MGFRYRKTWWGLTSLFIWEQSAFPRALPFALFALVEAVLLHVVLDQYNAFSKMRDKWSHPYPFQAFVAIVGFITVFRCVEQAER
jgi:hypothetical protein